MRTALFMLSGFLLLAACAVLARLFSGNYPRATLVGTVIFAVLWLLASGANLWVGVSKAGYSFNEEFPIFLLIFGVPVLAAVLLKWWFL